MASANEELLPHAALSPLERLLSRQGRPGHELRRSATTTKLFPKTKPRVDVGTNGDHASRKGRKRMRRVRSNLLRPLAQKHAPSRDVKHLVTSGHPLSNKALKHSAVSSTQSHRSLAHPPRQGIPLAPNSQVVLLIDTNVAFTANDHERIKRAIESGLPLPYIYRKRSIFGETNALSSSFPAKRSSKNRQGTFHYNSWQRRRRQVASKHQGHRVKVRLRYTPETVPGVHFGGTAEPAAFYELFCSSHVFQNRKLKYLLPFPVTILTYLSVDIDKCVETKLQLFLSGLLTKILGVPIDRYYLRFEQNEGGHDRKTIVMINYRDKIAQNPYERMQALKRSKKGKKRQLPTHRMESFSKGSTNTPKNSFSMHTSVAGVGLREQSVPLSRGVESCNGSNLDIRLHGQVPIQVSPESISKLEQGDRLLDRRIGHSRARSTQGYVTLLPPHLMNTGF